MRNYTTRTLPLTSCEGGGEPRPDVAESTLWMSAFVTSRTCWILLLTLLEFIAVCLLVFLLLLVSREDGDQVDKNGEAGLVILERSIKVSCCR